jgi:hypothetical protein
MRGTKIKKKMSNMGGVPKSFFKIHLGSQTLKQCKLYNLDPFGFHKNQFLYKSLFIVFFSPWLERRERERSRQISMMREKVVVQAISDH